MDFAERDYVCVVFVPMPPVDVVKVLSRIVATVVTALMIMFFKYSPLLIGVDVTGFAGRRHF